VPRQIYLDGYIDAGVLVAIALANDVRPDRDSAFDLIAAILEFDPPSRLLLRKNHVKEFVALSTRLRRVLEKLTCKEVDGAAALLNDLLASHPAHPYLAKEDGTWRLHHHPSDAPLVSMYTSICAEGLARAVGEGNAHRFGRCEASDCARVFFDSSKNGTKRFCSTKCQSRTKVARFRQRRR
jgi:predicted RNA-binding Zn ribbon-like protein